MANRIQDLANHLSLKQNRISQVRKQYPLDNMQLKNIIFQQKYAKIRQQVFKFFIENRQLFRHSDIEDHSFHQQRFLAARALFKYQKERKKIVDPQRYEQDYHALSITAHTCYNFDPGMSVKFDIHYFLYYGAVRAFHTTPFHKQIMRKAQTLQDIGCFGLTQVGHGSNVRGIQTTAVYDHPNRQFIINSNQAGMKFWIGAAAQMANISLIWANLIIDGKQYGPHPFVVPLRDRNTYQSLQGVKIGDCGHKNGNNNIDNGFIIFKNYKLKKQYLLDKVSGIDQNGNFHSKIQDIDKRFGLYMNPLSKGRAFITINPVYSAINALTIAIRYCFSRRQFQSPNNKQQTLLIDYPLTKYRMMPLLAQGIVYMIGGADLLRTYDTNIDKMLDPKNKIINQLHAISGSLKAKSSWYVTQVFTQCRQMLGGHGYSSFSRLGRLFHDNDINSTWQGDNHMLLQQTTKYILKMFRKAQKGKNFDGNELAFLTENIELPENIKQSDLHNFDFLEKVLKKRIIDITMLMVNAMLQMKQQERKNMDIWNRSQAYYGKQLALSFGDLHYFHVLRKKLKQASSALKQILTNCLKLWVFNCLENQRWQTIKTRTILQKEIIKLCEWLAPRSISLTDAICAPEQVIGSPFAQPNGYGMKKYLNLVWTAKNTFQRVLWYEQLVRMKQKM